MHMNKQREMQKIKKKDIWKKEKKYGKKKKDFITAVINDKQVQAGQVSGEFRGGKRGEPNSQSLLLKTACVCVYGFSHSVCECVCVYA